jgi:hypothetical protein
MSIGIRPPHQPHNTQAPPTAAPPQNNSTTKPPSSGKSSPKFVLGFLVITLLATLGASTTSHLATLDFTKLQLFASAT